MSFKWYYRDTLENIMDSKIPHLTREQLFALAYSKPLLALSLFPQVALLSLEIEYESFLLGQQIVEMIDKLPKPKKQSKPKHMVPFWANDWKSSK